MNRREFAAGGLAVPAASASPLIVRAFDAGGAPAARNFLESLLAIDSSGRPFEILPKAGADAATTLEVPNAPFELMMILPVRGFGQVYLYADNSSKQYPASRRGELLLNYEFARSRAAFVLRYVQAARREGVGFPPDVGRHLAAGEAALARATQASQPAERARYRIGRRGPRPGFLFGANAFAFDRSPVYAQQYTALLNFATLPFYRASTEKEEGRPDYSCVDALLDRLVGTGILTKGHPLVWFHRAGVPAFLKSKTWNEARRGCREYILGSVGRYRSLRAVEDARIPTKRWACKSTTPGGTCSKSSGTWKDFSSSGSRCTSPNWASQARAGRSSAAKIAFRTATCGTARSGANRSRRSGWSSSTLCYRKPEIEAVSWWDMSDPAFIPHSGFLRPDFQPKESYHRLKRLIDGWRA